MSTFLHYLLSGLGYWLFASLFFSAGVVVGAFWAANRARNAAIEEEEEKEAVVRGLAEKIKENATADEAARAPAPMASPNVPAADATGASRKHPARQAS